MLKVSGVEVPEDAIPLAEELLAIAVEEHRLAIRRMIAEAQLALRTLAYGERKTYKTKPLEISVERMGEAGRESA